tara:strand:- start:556 stop:885 length:330 start_codon:yes stop_codon:yes gene_type:complete
VNYITEALVPTDNAKKYAAQLGKHWAHNLSVQEDGEAFLVTFPKDARGADWPGDAVVTLDPADGGMRCRIEATAEEQRDGLKGAVERHVDRFAFREAPLSYKWQDSQNI